LALGLGRPGAKGANPPKNKFAPPLPDEIRQKEENHKI